MGLLKMRWSATLAVLLVLGLLVSACGGSSSSGAGTEGASNNGSAGETGPSSVKIGAIVSATGAASAYGESMTAGLELATEQINANGGVSGIPIELHVEDDESKADVAIAAAQKLINSNKVLAIIGPTLSTNMFAIGPVTDDEGVPTLGATTTADGITDIGPYIFRSALPEASLVPATVAAAKEKLGIQKVAILYGNDDDFTMTGYHAFQKALQDHDVTVLGTQTFTKGQTNFSAPLTNIRSLQPDALVVSALFMEAANIAKQARQMGIDVPILGGNGFNAPQYIELAGEAAENTYVSSPWFVGRDNPKTQAFVESYKAKYGAAPDQFAAQAYDAFMLIAEALANDAPAALSDRKALRDAMANIEGFEGVIGEFAFDENRNPVQDPVVLTIKNGQFTEFK